MHELSIAKNIFTAIEAEMIKCGAKKLRSLKVRIGELTAVDPEALRFAFDSCTENTPMQGANFIIEEVALTGLCAKCATKFPIINYGNICPHCDSASVERLTGTELDIVSMEVF